METELLSVDDLTKILRSISKVQRKDGVRDRRLPAAKIGKHIGSEKRTSTSGYEGKLLIK